MIIMVTKQVWAELIPSPRPPLCFCLICFVEALWKQNWHGLDGVQSSLELSSPPRLQGDVSVSQPWGPPRWAGVGSLASCLSFPAALPGLHTPSRLWVCQTWYHFLGGLCQDMKIFGDASRLHKGSGTKY